MTGFFCEAFLLNLKIPNPFLTEDIWKCYTQTLHYMNLLAFTDKPGEISFHHKQKLVRYQQAPSLMKPLVL